MRTNRYFPQHHVELVHQRHGQLKNAGLQPDLEAVRQQILRLDHVDLSCERVAKYLLMPLQGGRHVFHAKDVPTRQGDAEAPAAIMYMPGGVHTISPSQNGNAVTVTVLVNELTARRLERQRQVLEDTVGKPFFSVQHSSQIAAFWPSRFLWGKRRDVTGKLAEGVWAEGEWSQAGLEAVAGRNVRAFSPTFHFDTLRNATGRPIQIACNQHAKLNMGALENDPAFKTISPLWADPTQPLT